MTSARGPGTRPPMGTSLSKPTAYTKYTLFPNEHNRHYSVTKNPQQEISDVTYKRQGRFSLRTGISCDTYDNVHHTSCIILRGSYIAVSFVQTALATVLLRNYLASPLLIVPLIPCSNIHRENPSYVSGHLALRQAMR